MRTERLGFVPAVLIVWASGFLINLVLGAFLFQASVGFAVATGSLRHGDSRPWVAAAAFIGIKALVGGLAVTFGVRMLGFNVSYGVAAFALGLGALLTTVMTFATISTAANDPTAVAGPAFGVLFFPLGLVLGTLLPAFLIDASTMRQSAPIPPGRPYSGMPPAGQGGLTPPGVGSRPPRR